MFSFSTAMQQAFVRNFAASSTKGLSGGKFESFEKSVLHGELAGLGGPCGLLAAAGVTWKPAPIDQARG